MVDPMDYTVGWVCAIHTEHVAAQAFLDEKHDGPEYVSPNDNNIYTLGRVGKHKVVIAVLPDGEYGIAAAVGVARDMLHSFPNIRIGLMVGIGGGAPSRKHDIRLGDIVVSAPRDGKSGVFQYDFSKTIQDQTFQTTGFLNQPPMLLRAAVNDIKAKYEIEGHQLEDTINSVLEKYPRLRKKYQRPDRSSDRLYKSGYIHPLADESGCEAACGEDPLHQIFRAERTDEDDNPAIHYGLIASANQLMKDALIRDTLAAEKGVLCFEMEAAGLMNQFPCLVIRGICDYSDSHENKEWQGYAAMAAAAYAKDLLKRIAPNKVEAERKIREILSSVETEVNKIHNEVQDTSNDVKHLTFKQKQEKIDHWLSAPDPSTNYNKALQQRHEGSGLWFSNNDIFDKWKTQPNSLLWLHGKSGCGKTILSSTIIKDLQSEISFQPLLYFYFDFTDTKKQHLENMVRSLISQLYYKHPNTSQTLDSLFSLCEDGKEQPDSESLRKVLLQMIEQANEVWLILDALDECNTKKQLVSWIQEVLNSEQRNIHLLVTSQRVPDIEAGIKEFAHHDNIMEIESSVIADDIEAYIRTRVRGGKEFKRWQKLPKIQNHIEIELTKKADGMFRWVACQLDVLADCIDDEELNDALSSLPKTLYDTYNRMILHIPPRRKEKAIRILQFLAFSEQPLRIEEAVEVIAVKPREPQHFDPNSRMPDPQEITFYCSSLVTVVPTKDHSHDQDNRAVMLQLAHSSVKEYLTSSQLDKHIAQNFQEITARATIATVCLAYLLYLDREPPTGEIVKRFPFVQYSARYWMSNAAVAESDDKTLQSFIRRFFEDQGSSYKICYSLYRPDQPWKNDLPWEIAKPASALYYASIGGMVDTVKYLLTQGADVNIQGGDYGSALQAASANGHDKIVELLLSQGADVKIQGGDYGSVLQAASANGYDKIVELLLSQGADVKIQGGNYGSALQAASANGHNKIVELLLSQGADINIQGGLYGSALKAASTNGHDKIVELLLSQGADVNIQDAYYGSALQVASENGQDKIVELLLSQGADVNIQGGLYGSVLQAASANGHDKIVKLLLSQGADINIQGGYYGSALEAASKNGYDKIVELLLSQRRIP
ncbi:Ankyrin repeat protein [Rutstroemia sp. NJR-2017a BBW]|nr:Ankyrin repeat protein [Rutstroemia sp. NJR-2017a BBW]